jgi:predicted dehydrogenase
VAEVLEAGRLGELRTLYTSRLQLKTAATGWRLDPALGGGALFDLLIHDFDLLGWYLGPPERVQACGLRNDTGVREYVAAAFTYPGIVAVVEGGFILPDTERFRSTLRICGTAGCLELDPATFPGLRLVLDGHSPQTVALGPYESTHRGIIGEYEEFLARIAGNPPQRLRLDDARRAIEYATLTAQAIQA